MTREEAKDLLDNLLGMVEDNQDNDYDTALQMGIKALEQEPCADAVSKKAVLGLFNKSDMRSWAMSLLKREIEEIPPVKPVACIAEIKFSKEDMQKLVNEKIKEITAELEERKWIPVKERLPETDGDYLLFGKIDDFEDEYYKFIGEFDSVAEKFGICRDCFDPNTLGCLGSDFYEYGEVLAWMPLPDDYKEGKESE